MVASHLTWLPKAGNYGSELAWACDVRSRFCSEHIRL